MKRRIRLKKKYTYHNTHTTKITRKKVILFTLLFFILCTIFSLQWIGRKVNPVLLTYGQREIEKISKTIMNKAVSNQVTENLNVDELFIISKDNNGEINTIDFDPVIVNNVLTMVTTSVQENLKYLEQGKIDQMDVKDVLLNYDLKKLKEGVIYEIPSGIVFGNSLLSNLGPKIPVRLNLYGDISSGIKTSITNYGINNAMIEASVEMTVHQQVILPFVTKEVTIKGKFPLAVKLIRGNIPEYYFNGMDKNSSNVTIPSND